MSTTEPSAHRPLDPAHPGLYLARKSGATDPAVFARIREQTYALYEHLLGPAANADDTTHPKSTTKGSK